MLATTFNYSASLHQTIGSWYEIALVVTAAIAIFSIFCLTFGAYLLVGMLAAEVTARMLNSDDESVYNFLFKRKNAFIAMALGLMGGIIGLPEDAFHPAGVFTLMGVWNNLWPSAFYAALGSIAYASWTIILARSLNKTNA